MPLFLPLCKNQYEHCRSRVAVSIKLCLPSKHVSRSNSSNRAKEDALEADKTVKKLCD
jgi:hypothetical protein